jgi:hypothetical protein
MHVGSGTLPKMWLLNHHSNWPKAGYIIQCSNIRWHLFKSSALTLRAVKHRETRRKTTFQSGHVPLCSIIYFIFISCSYLSLGISGLPLCLHCQILGGICCRWEVKSDRPSTTLHQTGRRFWKIRRDGRV